uniref:Uncharacterized protein n=1 Tax=Aureoumbra lagunensis TaxID=44058 RepID=A0A7S3NR22_9STRA|mmetsp:Transcript_17502/g.22818  ORF Transcript_17502/g.22818 Transcript_17502/m.22818 type:complete len:473 (-) Transcript_17502:382-1800(-)
MYGGGWRIQPPPPGGGMPQQEMGPPGVMQTNVFPSCYLCLKLITDARDVPVRDEDGLISVIIRMATFPGSRLAACPPPHARLCRPCYDHLKRLKEESIVSKKLLERVRLMVWPFWGQISIGARRPASPPLCPGMSNAAGIDPNVRRRLVRNLSPETVARVETAIIQYIELNNELHRDLHGRDFVSELSSEERLQQLSPELRSVLLKPQSAPTRPHQQRKQKQQRASVLNFAAGGPSENDTNHGRSVSINPQSTFIQPIPNPHGGYVDAHLYGTPSTANTPFTNFYHQQQQHFDDEDTSQRRIRDSRASIQSAVSDDEYYNSHQPPYHTGVAPRHQAYYQRARTVNQQPSDDTSTAATLLGNLAAAQYQSQYMTQQAQQPQAQQQHAQQHQYPHPIMVQFQPGSANFSPASSFVFAGAAPHGTAFAGQYIHPSSTSNAFPQSPSVQNGQSNKAASPQSHNHVKSDSNGGTETE